MMQFVGSELGGIIRKSGRTSVVLNFREEEKTGIRSLILEGSVPMLAGKNSDSDSWFTPESNHLLLKIF